MDRLLIKPNGRATRYLRPEIERLVQNQLCAVT